MRAPAQRRITADEFFSWAVDQPDHVRYELVGGELVAMAPEQAVHVRVKARAYRALEDAIAKRQLSCEAFTDGMAVRIDEDTVYEPDALVRCGPPLPGDAVEIGDPVIVVEVISRSTGSLDTGLKFTDYFRLPSIRHYLMIRTDRRLVTHHHRDAAGQMQTRMLHTGEISLDPPGLVVDIERFFASGSYP